MKPSHVLAAGALVALALLVSAVLPWLMARPGEARTPGPGTSLPVEAPPAPGPSAQAGPAPVTASPRPEQPVSPPTPPPERPAPAMASASVESPTPKAHPTRFAGTEREWEGATLDEALEAATSAATEAERVHAVRWLGTNAGMDHFSLLQQVQMEDASPQVRKAAEAATDLLRTRFLGQRWRGAPAKESPFSYMGQSAPSMP